MLSMMMIYDQIYVIRLTDYLISEVFIQSYNFHSNDVTWRLSEIMIPYTFQNCVHQFFFLMFVLLYHFVKWKSDVWVTNYEHTLMTDWDEKLVFRVYFSLIEFIFIRILKFLVVNTHHIQNIMSFIYRIHSTA